LKPKDFVWDCLSCGGLNRTPLPKDESEVVLICEHCGLRVDDRTAKTLFPNRQT
jgi:transcription elongation factor Elf1